MRPHLLELEAFGAFPGAVRLDLDALGESGLVLLCGDTGGGKTTLLDALGFALYGVVPGERARAGDDLRSHHAPDGATARVRLEFTARGRRLRLTRTPAQTRPSRRGAGLVGDSPTALLERRTAAGWEPLAQRPEDVGHEVERLLGMDSSQFFQVVVLPQGRFAAFLQAGHKERERLLKRLFHVDRFEHAEAWLTDRAAAAARQVDAARSELERLAARVAQEAGAEPPTDLVGAPSWAAEWSAAAAAELAGAAEQARQLLAVRTGAEAALAEAERIAARQRARLDAEQELARLEQDADRISLLAEELDASVRARPVQVALLAAAEGESALVVAASARGAALAQITALAPAEAPAGAVEPADEVSLRSRAADLRTERGRLDGLVEVQQRAVRSREAAATAQRAGQVHTERQSAMRERMLALPDQLVAAEEAVARAMAAEQALPEARRALAEGEAQLVLHAELAQLADRLVSTADAAASAGAAHEQAQQAARQLRVERVDGLIAELAALLEPDTPCPVCGATAHPDIAELAFGGVSKDDEEAAERAAVAHLERLRERERETVQLQERRAGLSGRLAAEPVDLPLLRGTMVDLERDGAAMSPARELRSTLQQEQVRSGNDLARVETLKREEARRAEESGALADELRERLVAELGHDLDLGRRRGEVDELATACERAAGAVATAALAAHALERAQAAAAAVCAANGFAGPAAAAGAVRPERWHETTTEQLSAHRDRLTGLRARLADAELDVGPHACVPLAARRDEAQRTSTEHQAAVVREGRAQARAAALAELAPRYAIAHAALAPLQAEAAEVRALAELAAGRGDNRLSMPLSSFVLAARLEQVAEAASARLSRMSGGRYTLVHTDAGRDRRSRAGLGLQVEDGWTGRRRDTATLSGGETFITALSLALGLADVVSAEAGGQSIDALFVDEGFGSLDAGSLDSVMDVLDELRSGGRLVGVVSHVADLRQRIPTQIRVLKGVSGSRVETT